jgi:bifunctional isochorismate lyase / aryl carrier protein
MTAMSLVQKTHQRLRMLRPYVRASRRERFPFITERTALLVIDMQGYFLHPPSHASFPEAEEIMDNVISLVDSFRSSRRPIIFTRHAVRSDEDPGIMVRWWGDVPGENDPLSQIDDRLEPDKDGTIVRKNRYSAFSGTELEGILRDLRVDKVVITGVMTHLCCESTARDAFMRDLEVFFVMDATATDHEDLHMGSLRALADGFAIVVTTEEVLGWMEGKQ